MSSSAETTFFEDGLCRRAAKPAALLGLQATGWMTMADELACREQVLREYARRYTVRDRAGWLDLFVDEPEIIEPADAPARHGRLPLEQAYDATAAAELDFELVPVQIIANGSEAAMHMEIRRLKSGQITRVDSVIEIFTFDECGKIMRMRAFLPRSLV